MERIHVNGGIPLKGSVSIQGSKNASLPILAATLLMDGPCAIENCPKIMDVYQMITLLASLGCRIQWENKGVIIDTKSVSANDLPKDVCTSMRSSITLLGVLLSKFKEATLDYPGGCIIGDRPIDMHLEALRKMGVKFKSCGDVLYATTKGLHGADIILPKISVGTTENIILAGVLAEGETCLYNAAKEPEIIALCDFLNHAGANISGHGTEKIKIIGVPKLHGIKTEIPSDRIVAGTYIYACIATGGEVLLKKAVASELLAVLHQIEEMGTQYQISKEGIYIQAQAPLQMPMQVMTEEYPGFPTDLQSPLMAAMCVSVGTGEIVEQIFDNRFHIVKPLQAMGANIRVLNHNKVKIVGVETLLGNRIEAKELRGGAALVIAGLCASGETVITNCGYIARGYENICRDFTELGARIYCV